MTSATRKECFAECRPCGARWLLMVLPCAVDDFPKETRCPWCGEQEQAVARATLAKATGGQA